MLSGLRTKLSSRWVETRSFAQCGEDRIAAFILDTLSMPQPTYLDLGANDPCRLNNTFFFYLRGGRGVLVEPDPRALLVHFELLRELGALVAVEFPPRLPLDGPPFLALPAPAWSGIESAEFGSRADTARPGSTRPRPNASPTRVSATRSKPCAISMWHCVVAPSSGTGNGSPWSRHFRSPQGGDNLYISSVVALRPDTGDEQDRRPALPDQPHLATPGAS